MLRRNVLIFHAGALGDFVLSWPLALALGRMYPQSRIIYVAQSQKCELAEKVLRVESANVESGWHHLFGNVQALPEPCLRRLQGAHSIFSFVAVAGDTWMKSVAQIAPEAQVTPLAVRPPDGYAAHASEYLVQSLAGNPAVQTAVRQLLASIAAQGITTARPQSPDHILIHPGSGSREKCWPAESYLALIDRLQKAGKRVRVILGEAELDAAHPLGWKPQTLAEFSKLAQVIQSTTYLQLLEELKNAALFIGNDSGPAHLAGIIGLPTIALFGPTNPAIWKPLGPRVRVLHQPLLALNVDYVYDMAMGA